MKDNYDEYCASPDFERLTDKVLPWMWKIIGILLLLLTARHAVSFFRGYGLCQLNQPDLSKNAIAPNTDASIAENR